MTKCFILNQLKELGCTLDFNKVGFVLGDLTIKCQYIIFWSFIVIHNVVVFFFLCLFNPTQ